MAKTAVVILNYNGEDYLRKFLPSVIACSEDAEIIVADNKSTDDSISILNQEFPQVKIILLDKNYGYAGGYNKALEQVTSEYVALLNSDVEVTEGWLSTLIKFLGENPSYAACQPKIKDYNHRAKFEYAGASGGFIDSLGYPYCRGRIFDTIEFDSGQYDDPKDIFWSTGACMVIRNEVYKKAGGLDADFFAHMEEIDLCWRIKSLGYKVKVMPSSVVFHVGGGTLSKLNSFKTYLNFRNGLLMLIKNLPPFQLLLKLPLRLVLDWVAAVKFFLEGNAKHGFAICKAHFKVLTTLKHTLKKRKLSSPIHNSNVIVLSYYLRKKEKFDQL